jgi:hypothetical protein
MMNYRHKNVSTTKAFRKFIEVLETDLIITGLKRNLMMSCRHKNVSTTKAFRKFIDILETDYN